jgi:hypothetical protein
LELQPELRAKLGLPIASSLGHSQKITGFTFFIDLIYALAVIVVFAVI